ncbi:MAG: hypothetical protein Q7W55_10950 [Pseudohongiella sp.]|nr:hypothetical protein [Pseudohongiella sp.]
MSNAALLLNGSNPLRKAKDDFELSITPTKLEAKAGFPSMIEGLTTEAQSLKRFAESTKDLMKTIGDTHFRVHADLTLTDGAKLVRSANHAEGKIKAARDEFMRMADQTGETLTRLSAEMKTAINPPTSMGEALVEQELRAWAKQQEVGTLALRAREDPALLAAIARAPAVLSGIDPQTHATLQAEQMKALFPDVYARAQDLKQAFDTANQALGSVESVAKGLIDFDTARELDSRKVSAVL